MYKRQFITWALPAIIIGPRVLSGELEIGVITQAATAFSIILGSLTLLLINWINLQNLLLELIVYLLFL